MTGGKGLFYLNYALTHSMHAIAVSKGALVVEGKKLINLAHQHNKNYFLVVRQQQLYRRLICLNITWLVAKF